MTRRHTLLAALCLATLAVAPPAMADDHPVRIAFVDTGNTGRSVTAEGLAHQLIDRKHLNVRVISRAANLDPFDTVPEANFVTLLAKRGIHTGSHRAVQIGPQDVKFADVILTMTASHKAYVVEHFPDAKDKVFTLAEYATGAPGEVLDAYGKPMDFYQKVLEQLDGLVGKAVEKAVAGKK